MAAPSFPPSAACGVGPSGVSSAPPPPARAPPAADAAKVAASGALSFKDAASRRKETSHHPAAVPEAPAITVQLPKDTLEIASELSKIALVCRFNGFWPSLADLRSWISSSWPVGVIVCPCAKGFFVTIFDSPEDRIKVTSSGPWFWDRAGLSMQPWTPDFDPSTASISSAPVWVRLPSLPLHFWGDQSLESIGNGLGKFLCRSPDSIIDRTTFARICVDMDFKNGFPAEINLCVKGFSWIQKIDYENLCFRCRACYETGHIARNCEKSTGKRRSFRSQRPTWWTNAPQEKQAEGKTPDSAPEGEADPDSLESVQRTDPVERSPPSSPKPTQHLSSWADIADTEEAKDQPGNLDQGQNSEWQTVSRKKKKPTQPRTNVMTRSRTGSLN